MLLLALYCTYCAPTTFLYTLHSSQFMLWGLKRAMSGYLVSTDKSPKICPFKFHVVWTVDNCSCSQSGCCWLTPRRSSKTSFSPVVQVAPSFRLRHKTNWMLGFSSWLWQVLLDWPEVLTWLRFPKPPLFHRRRHQADPGDICPNFSLPSSPRSS